MDGVFFSLQYFVPRELLEIGPLSFILLALALRMMQRTNRTRELVRTSCGLDDGLAALYLKNPVASVLERPI